MNLGQATIVLRSRKAMEVVDLSLRFLRQLGPKPYLRLAAGTLIPAWIVCVALRHGLGWSWFAIWPIALCASWLLELPFLCLAGRLLFDREAQAGQALRGAWALLVPFVASRLLLWLMLGLGILVVIGPPLVAATYCFAAEALVLERAGAWDSLGRARKFLRGRSGTGVETVILRFFFCITCVLLAETVLRSVIVEGLDWAVSDEALFEDGGSAFALFGLFLGVPFATTFRFLAYINERTRQDGWDVQVALLGLTEADHA